jgi:hypothetical protein
VPRDNDSGDVVLKITSGGPPSSAKELRRVAREAAIISQAAATALEAHVIKLKERALALVSGIPVGQLRASFEMA